MDVRSELYENRDLKYKEFQLKLIPGFDPEKMIGVRIPILRKIGKKLNDNSFEHYYYEEIMLHGFYIGYSKSDFRLKLRLLDEFVPEIDNWAVCDCVASTLKFIRKNQKEFLEYLKKYMKSSAEFELRFAVVILMYYYIDDEYAEFILEFLKNIKSNYYYVNMAAAWALSNAFVKYSDKVIEIIESGVLSAEIQNFTISKIADSFRVDRKTKEYIKTLRV